MAGKIPLGNVGDTGGGPQEMLPHPYIPPTSPGVVGASVGRRAEPCGGGGRCWRLQNIWDRSCSCCQEAQGKVANLGAGRDIWDPAGG